MADGLDPLQGPEIRTGQTKDDADLPIQAGDIVTFTTDEKYIADCVRSTCVFSGSALGLLLTPMPDNNRTPSTCMDLRTLKVDRI